VLSLSLCQINKQNLKKQKRKWVVKPGQRQEE